MTYAQIFPLLTAVSKVGEKPIEMNTPELRLRRCFLQDIRRGSMVLPGFHFMACHGQRENGGCAEPECK